MAKKLFIIFIFFFFQEILKLNKFNYIFCDDDNIILKQ